MNAKQASKLTKADLAEARAEAQALKVYYGNVEKRCDEERLLGAIEALEWIIKVVYDRDDGSWFGSRALESAEERIAELRADLAKLKEGGR